MLTDAEKRAVVRSWRLAIPIADTIGELFYRRLFELRPEYRKLFSPDIVSQKRKLVQMLAFIVKAIDWSEEQWKDDIDPTDDLFLVVLALGRRHNDLYRIPEESYTDVGDALLWTLDYGLGDAFNDETRAAWDKLYKLLSRIMLMGGSASRLTMNFGRRD